mgnify:CR=1 FL=1
MKNKFKKLGCDFKNEAECEEEFDEESEDFEDAEADEFGE